MHIILATLTSLIFGFYVSKISNISIRIVVILFAPIVAISSLFYGYEYFLHDYTNNGGATMVEVGIVIASLYCIVISAIFTLTFSFYKKRNKEK